jgi:hypothetical protein
MTQNTNISISIFWGYCKKNALFFFAFWVFFAFCVITVVPIMIQTCLEPKNDRLNLSFVKDFHIVGTKMARNGSKMAIYQMQILIFISDLAKIARSVRVHFVS